VVDLETFEWKEIKSNRLNESLEAVEDYPVERSGHSCDVIDHYMVIFGGFMNLTKELNDLYIFDFHT